MNSRIILAKNIHIDKEYVNVLSYKENEMVNLCLENKIAEATDYSFIRNINRLQTAFTYEQCLQANYIAFQNKNYSNKWFFAWIIDVNYKGERNTEITFQIDSWSTWFDYWTKKVCFINRQHVNDDTIGKNIIDEGLNVGDYTNAEQPVKILNNTSDYYICMAVTELPDGTLPETTKDRIYNGIYSGLIYLAFENATDVTTAIKMYDNKAKADAISYLFMIPKNLTSVVAGQKATWNIPNVGSCNVIYIKETNDSDNIENINAVRPSHVGKNYFPKNKKLFTYPFNYSVLTNNNGITEIFKYEDFEYETEFPNNFGFWIDASLTPGMSYKAIPVAYKNINLNNEYSIPRWKIAYLFVEFRCIYELVNSKRSINWSFTF